MTLDNSESEKRGWFVRLQPEAGARGLFGFVDATGGGTLVDVVGVRHEREGQKSLCARIVRPNGNGLP